MFLNMQREGLFSSVDVGIKVKIKKIKKIFITIACGVPNEIRSPKTFFICLPILCLRKDV